MVLGDGAARPAVAVVTLQATAADTFATLLDDAAIFPPGNAPMSEALQGYVHSRGSTDARCIGAFLCSAARLAELVEALPEEVAQLDLSLALAGVDELWPALADVAAHERLVLRAVEVPAGEAGARGAVEALEAALPSGVVGYVELPLGPELDAAAQTVAEAGRRVKLRTGGTTASAFPTEPALAAGLSTCVQVGAAFKLTAGLHDAVRHRDTTTGFEHHGFLNVLVAVSAALAGAGVDDLERVLADRDGAALAEQVRSLTPDQVQAVRSHFVAFGTCSTSDPLSDLHRLGLLPVAA